MTLISRRDYAFILNRHPFPSPFLVEISRRTKTQRKNVAFYLPDVIFCPQEMKLILEAILYDAGLFKFHRQVVKEAMVAVLENDKNGTPPPNPSSLETIAVEAIIKEEISKILNPRADEVGNTRSLVTRRRKHTFQKIISDWRKLRARRVIDESYLQYTFTEDVKRSKSELSYVCNADAKK